MNQMQKCCAYVHFSEKGAIAFIRITKETVTPQKVKILCFKVFLFICAC